MKIVITAAGLGNRFKKIGIKEPKYMIIAKNKSLFEWSMISLKNFFNEEFIFIFRKEIYNEKFIYDTLKKIGIKKFKIILLNEITSGQAETVMSIENYVNKQDSIMIYNIDTAFNSDHLFKRDIVADLWGFIQVTKTLGEHWSFVKLENNKVVEVVEKKRISDFASTGLYYFKNFDIFKEIFVKHKNDIIKKYGESYIAPMFQFMINEYKDAIIGTKELPFYDFFPLGTPEEISSFDNNFHIFYKLQ